MTRAAAAGVLLLATAACWRNEHIAAPAATPRPVLGTAAVLELDGAARAGRDLWVRVRVHRDAGRAPIGGVRGRVRFDPSLMQYGGEDHGHTSFAAVSDSTGLVRFAGITTNGFPDGVALRIRFRVLQSFEPGQLTLELDELNDVNLLGLLGELTIMTPSILVER